MIPDAPVRYVAIGDSFTEGCGDERADGSLRGWADIAAQGWADLSGRPVSYANLAIRGRLAWPVVDEQLERALALGPTHLSFNAGGNDMLRPGVDFDRLADAFSSVLQRCDEEGVTLILHSGANPSRGLPATNLIQSRGDRLSDVVLERFAGRDDVVRVLNWPDRELMRSSYWSEDRLHLGPRGHHRVAARMLSELGMTPPAPWWSLPVAGVAHLPLDAYLRTHVAAWVGRRLTGRSSGDSISAKFPEWVLREPVA